MRNDPLDFEGSGAPGRRRHDQENRRQARLLLLFVLVFAGIHCFHHRGLYWGKQNVPSAVTTGTSRLDSLKAIGDGACLVSWYGESYHGRPTATRTDSLGRQRPGPPYDMYAHTCAHRSLPFGTVVVFTREVKKERLYFNQKSIGPDSIAYRGKMWIVEILRDTCPVTDRGPYIEGREYDLSYGSALKLEMVDAGVVMVRAEVIK